MSESEKDTRMDNQSEPSEKPRHESALTEIERERATDSVCRQLGDFFSGSKSGRKIAVAVAKELGKSIPEKQVNVNTFFWDILKRAHEEGRIAIGQGRVSELEMRLNTRFFPEMWPRDLSLRSRGLDRIRVVNCHHFHDRPAADQKLGRTAAELFLMCLTDVLQKKGSRDPVEVNIGVVGGQSCFAVRNAFKELDLQPYDRLRQATINFCALNAMDEPKKHLALRQAGLIAQLFALDFLEKVPSAKVGCFWFYGPTLLRKSGAREKNSQTDQEINQKNKEILEKTDPKILNPDGTASKLDIVIMGAGATDESIFREFLGERQLDDLEKKGWVGDLLCYPVDAQGADLAIQDAKPYSALQLTSLRELAKQEDKHVILVAMNDDGPDKTSVIKAALKGRYINRLVTSTRTAEKLMGTDD